MESGKDLIMLGQCHTTIAVSIGLTLFNNSPHDPIGLEDVWVTKWWLTRQFTFICSVAEVNAVNS